MNRPIKFWFFIALAGMLSVGCSTGNSSGQGELPKPQPQVRVEAMPSATAAALSLPVEIAAPSPEASPTAFVVQFYIEPTPDEDAIANLIEAMLNEIDRKLQGEKFLLNP